MRKKIGMFRQLIHGGAKHVVLTVKSRRQLGKNFLRCLFDIRFNNGRSVGQLPVESRKLSMKGKASQQLIQFCNEISFGKYPRMINRVTVSHDLTAQIIPKAQRQEDAQRADYDAQ